MKAPIPTRKVLLVSACVAVLAFAGMAAFFLSQPPLPPLPNPNGYDDFVSAAKITTREVSDFVDLTNDALRNLISSNAGSLRLTRLGLTRRCVVPTYEAMTNFGNAGVPLYYLKRLACLLAADGKLAELENRPDDAVQSYAQAVKFGNEISRGGLMINRLVGAACEGIGLIRLAKLIPNLTCAQAKSALAMLEQVDNERVEWNEIVHAENRYARWAIPHENFLHLPGDLWQAHKTRNGAQLMDKQAVAHARLLTVELALHCYRSDHGRAAEKLDVLVPKYLSRIPSDPFRNAPLVYRAQGTNWVLYSVGADGVDHGGRPTAKDSIGGAIFLDSKWWVSPQIAPW